MTNIAPLKIMAASTEKLPTATPASEGNNAAPPSWKAVRIKDRAAAWIDFDQPSREEGQGEEPDKAECDAHGEDRGCVATAHEEERDQQGAGEGAGGNGLTVR